MVPPPRNCQMSRLHGLHTYREREIRILSQYTQCVDVAQIYFYTQQPELMLFTLVTYIFFLCVCVRALASFFFHPIYHTRAAPTTPDNITQDGPLRNVVLKKISRQRNPGSFKRAREMIRRIKESTTRFVYEKRRRRRQRIATEIQTRKVVSRFYGPFHTWKQLHPTKISCVIKSIYE
jgi:hypothetical protein